MQEISLKVLLPNVVDSQPIRGNTEINMHTKLNLHQYYMLRGDLVKVIATPLDPISQQYSVTYRVINSMSLDLVGEFFTSHVDAFLKLAIPAQSRPWIGVDLDGTLVSHDDFVSDDVVGKPIPSMLARIRAWIVQGITVRIMTARAPCPRAYRAIQQWALDHGLPALEVTDTKDFAMMELWDDRAVTVLRNHGTIITEDVPDPNEQVPYRGMFHKLNERIYH